MDWLSCGVQWAVSSAYFCGCALLSGEAAGGLRCAKRAVCGGEALRRSSEIFRKDPWVAAEDWRTNEGIQTGQPGYRRRAKQNTPRNKVSPTGRC